MVHTFTRSSGSRIFHPTKVQHREQEKLTRYREAYRPQCVFVPLVADSLGRIGEYALRFFHFLATHTASQSSSVVSSSPTSTLSFHSLRLRFLHACYEATAQRVLRPHLPPPSSSSQLPPAASPSAGSDDQGLALTEPAVGVPNASASGSSGPAALTP